MAPDLGLQRLGAAALEIEGRAWAPHHSEQRARTRTQGLGEGLLVQEANKAPNPQSRSSFLGGGLY